MTTWHSEVARDRAALVELSDWWNRQPAAMEIPFLNTSLLGCWIDAFLEPDQKVEIPILYEDGEPVAAAAMVGTSNRLRSMGDQVDPFDLVSTGDPDTTEHLPTWLDSWKVAHFYKVRETSPLVTLASSQPRWVLSKIRTSPYVDLTPGIEVVRTNTSKEHRRAIQRRTRRLKELGELRFTDHPSTEETISVLDAGLQLEAAGWKGNEGGAVLRRPSHERWYRAIAQVADQNGWLRLSTLHLDERLIAFAYDLVYGGRRYGMLSAYDESPDLSRLSAGTILLDHMLEKGAEDGLTSYEFGHGSTGWKRNWTSTERTIYDMSVYGAGITGRSAYGLRRLRSRRAQRQSTT